MKLIPHLVALGISMSAVWFTSSPASGQQAVPLQPPAANGLESGMAEQTTDQETDWFEEHESNGPQGSHGVPMKCLSLPQLGLVVIILLSGAGLLAMERKRPAGSKPG